jgi:hypothetical protein
VGAEVRRVEERVAGAEVIEVEEAERVAVDDDLVLVEVTVDDPLVGWVRLVGPAHHGFRHPSRGAAVVR